MSTAFDRRVARHRRHHRIRKTVAGTPARPRLVVFRSSRHISAQVVDDSEGRTLASASTQQAGVADGLTGVAAAEVVGRLVAERARDVGIPLGRFSALDRQIDLNAYPAAGPLRHGRYLRLQRLTCGSVADQLPFGGGAI